MSKPGMPGNSAMTVGMCCHPASATHAGKMNMGSRNPKIEMATHSLQTKHNIVNHV